MNATRPLLFACALAASFAAAAEPNTLGQTGLLHMPDGRLEDDGTLRAGASYMAPYGALWGSITLVPWLEMSGRFTLAEGVSAFGGQTDYGDYKDKALDFKIRILEESEWLPAIAFGRQDFHGTHRLTGSFVAASKSFDVADLGTFDLTGGWGSGRFDGAFGGVRWYQPWLPNLALVAEYDGYDYDDEFARRRGDMVREGGFGVAVEYRRGLVSGHVAHQDGHLGFNVGVTLPLQQRTFTPKVDEPQPVAVERGTGGTLAEWQANDPVVLERVVRAFSAEGFRTSRIVVDADRVEIAISAGRYSTIGRVAGRASRIVAALAPAGIRRLELTLTETGTPAITYAFDDLEVLRGWLAGRATPEQLQATLSADYVDADAYAGLRADGLTLDDLYPDRDGDLRFRVGSWLYAFPMTISRDTNNPIVVRIRPINVGFIFNDPNGAFKFDLYSMATASKWLSDNVYVSSALRANLYDDYDDVVGRSNSDLPRVRSDFIEYKLEGQAVKLDSLLIAHLGNPRDRVYTWTSAGIYEEMFIGAGGEVLYLPRVGNWAVDFAAFGVRQRNFKGWFGLQDYETITAIGSFHYRLPRQGVTLTARAGRFLAGDSGVRFEVRRRFLSGFEVGAWYTHTDANDIRHPGTPSDPYQDKGLFIRYAIGPMLPFDSDAGVEVHMAPWQRDPGQMVRAPSGLYTMFERRLLLNLEDLGPWSDFGQ